MAANSPFSFAPLTPISLIPQTDSAKKESKEESRGEIICLPTYSPDFDKIMKKIEYHYSNEFCEWDDAVNSVILSVFGSQYDSKPMDALEAKKFTIDGEDIDYFLQQLIDRTDGVDASYTKHLYKCMRNIFLPLCMYLAPRILGDLLMANKTNTEFVNLLFDTTGSENLQDYFSGMLPQEIKEIYFAQFPTLRLLKSITRFLESA